MLISITLKIKLICQLIWPLRTRTATIRELWRPFLSGDSSWGYDLFCGWKQGSAWVKNLVKRGLEADVCRPKLSPSEHGWWDVRWQKLHVIKYCPSPWHKSNHWHYINHPVKIATLTRQYKIVMNVQFILNAHLKRLGSLEQDETFNSIGVNADTFINSVYVL